jgi:hypothetical protein
MADNTTLNIGAGGDVIATDDIGGVKFQRIKLVHGADGANDGDVSNANPLPVNATEPACTDVLYTQAGVIVINTALVQMDCARLRSISVQCLSMGTSGVVTAQFSNDNTTWLNVSLMTPAGVAAATFNAAGMWTTPVFGRYFRLLLSTATTAGTTTIDVAGFQANVSQPVVQPVSGSVSVSGTATVQPVTPTQTFTNSAASTNATSTKTSAGTVWSIQASNINAAARYLKLYNKASAPTVGTDVPVLTVPLPAGQVVQVNGGSNGIRFGTGIAWALTVSAADSATDAVAAGEIKVAISYT